MNTLIERLRDTREQDEFLYFEAADALEAKDAEIERLTVLVETLSQDYANADAEIERLKAALKKWKDECHRVQSVFEKETLRASELHEKVEQINEHRIHILASNDKLRVERDALQAKLDAIKKQEPIGEFESLPDPTVGELPWLNIYDIKDRVVGRKIYAAPVVAPAQDDDTTHELTHAQWLVKYQAAQKCISEWIAEHAKLNRETTIQAAKYQARIAELEAAPVVAERNPLTDKRISYLWSKAHDDTTDRMAFQVIARLVEQAHGIGGQP